MSTTRTVTGIDRDVLDALARAGLLYARQDLDVVRAVVPDGTSRRLAAMAERKQLARVTRDSYVVLPAGAKSLRQAADRRLLVAAAFDGRRPYYLGFASAIEDHKLTDESISGIDVAFAGRNVPRMLDLGGTPLRKALVPFDDDDGESWEGTDRERIRGKTFYVRSGLERTLVDALDRPELCERPEFWVRAWERAFRERGEQLDMSLLLDLARRRNHATSARAALLLRELGRPREAQLLLQRRVSGRVFFDASNTQTGSGFLRDRDTGLLLNVPLGAIRGWIEYGK